MGRVRTLHGDERGTISILSVVALLMLTLLLGMILNVGEQIDDKIRMQNSADASTYSSGVVIARSMNTVAFTNHLLSETFALTAYFREGRDRYAESLVPPILDAWEVVGQQLELSDFQLIRNIQPAVAPRIQMEREMVRAFGDMTAVKARLLLPALHAILGVPESPGGAAPNANVQQQIAATHLIPTFQRAVVFSVPAVVVAVTQELSRRNTPTRTAKAAQFVVWKTLTSSVHGISQQNQTINQNDPNQRVLPGLDPSFEGPDYNYLNPTEAYVYQQLARQRRDQLARHYLREWIDDDGFDLAPFEREGYHEGGRVSAKMSQFINLYRGFTCAKLGELLQNEFPNTNLPHMLRMPLDRQWPTVNQLPDSPHGFQSQGLTQQEYLELDFTFDGALYRNQRRPVMPGMYRVPIKGDALSFARVVVYLPRPRYVTAGGCPRFYCPSTDWFGSTTCGTPCHDRWPTEWSLFSQNWAAKICPTSPESTIHRIQTNPRPLADDVELSTVKTIDIKDVKAVNFH